MPNVLHDTRSVYSVCVVFTHYDARCTRSINIVLHDVRSVHIVCCMTHADCVHIVLHDRHTQRVRYVCVFLHAAPHARNVHIVLRDTRSVQTVRVFFLQARSTMHAQHTHCVA